MVKSIFATAEDKADLDCEISNVKHARLLGDDIGEQAAMNRINSLERARRIKTRRINRIAKDELVAALRMAHEAAPAGSSRRVELIEAVAAIEAVPAKDGSPESMLPIVKALELLLP